MLHGASKPEWSGAWLSDGSEWPMNRHKAHENSETLLAFVRLTRHGEPLVPRHMKSLEELSLPLQPGS